MRKTAGLQAGEWGRLPTHCLPYLENTEAHCAGPEGRPKDPKEQMLNVKMPKMLIAQSSLSRTKMPMACHHDIVIGCSDSPTALFRGGKPSLPQLAYCSGSCLAGLVPSKVGKAHGPCPQSGSSIKSPQSSRETVQFVLLAVQSRSRISMPESRKYLGAMNMK